MAGEERQRLEQDGAAWRRWGPYLAERAWGTVREDYSAEGDAWSAFPHDHARSRAFRWNEDGLAGWSDREQLLCLSLALWNGRDPILKERIFGLTGPQGNHGEDPKEYWFYLDATPTHSWLRWRYLYPHAEFPYGDLVAENARRNRHEPEYELLDTGVFDDDRYWEVTVDYAKADPEDLCARVTVRNAGPEEATIDVLPTLWFRNTWSWGLDDRRPTLRADGAATIRAEHWRLGTYHLRSAATTPPELLFCENESNADALWGTQATTPFPKDGINDHVVRGADTVNPEGVGTKAALRHRLTVPAGGTTGISLRLTREGVEGSGSDEVFSRREAEADDFYASLTPADATPDEAMVMRQAFAGMIWTKQFYHYDVSRWLAGDPAGPPPPEARKQGRNRAWEHLDNHDVVSMPDKWEYPWYAVWDSAFHCIPLAHLDPEFAKEQLLLFLREWYLHPNGQIPAYEWNFGDVNPPVHAWAALRVFQIDGATDFDFLARVFQKLLLNFTWWVNRKDAEGNNVFEGGFLGLDNIGPIDRSAEMPEGMRLEQSDGTAWMAMYALNMLTISLNLAEHDLAYEDIASKFLEHFVHIASAIDDPDAGLWDEADGFYYDVLHTDRGESTPLKVRSMVGLSPLYAVETMGPELFAHAAEFERRKGWFFRYRTESQDLRHLDDVNDRGAHLFAIVSPERLRRILAYMLSEDEFLSPHGLRALSAHHRDHPLNVDLGAFHASVGYEPAESGSPMFGGNSNWRGPVWFPVNYLLVESLREFHKWVGAGFTVELPTGSGNHVTLDQAADEITRRLVAIFLDDDGRRPVFGGVEKFQHDPAWHDLVPFHEYFNGDDGAGLGAPHQTGWTGLVADLITRRRRS